MSTYREDMEQLFEVLNLGWDNSFERIKKLSIQHEERPDLGLYPDKKEEFVELVRSFEAKFRTSVERGNFAHCHQLIRYLIEDARVFNKKHFSKMLIEVDVLSQWLTALQGWVAVLAGPLSTTHDG